jgi:hypothetical protein
MVVAFYKSHPGTDTNWDLKETKEEYAKEEFSDDEAQHEDDGGENEEDSD